MILFKGFQYFIYFTLINHIAKKPMKFIKNTFQNLISELILKEHSISRTLTFYNESGFYLIYST